MRTSKDPGFKEAFTNPLVQASVQLKANAAFSGCTAIVLEASSLFEDVLVPARLIQCVLKSPTDFLLTGNWSNTHEVQTIPWLGTNGNLLEGSRQPACSRLVTHPSSAQCAVAGRILWHERAQWAGRNGRPVPPHNGGRVHGFARPVWVLPVLVQVPTTAEAPETVAGIDSLQCTSACLYMYVGVLVQGRLFLNAAQPCPLRRVACSKYGVLAG